MSSRIRECVVLTLLAGPHTVDIELHTTVTSRLANKLIDAESAEAFLRNQGGRIGREKFGSFKSEVDRLVHGDLDRAGRLAARTGELAALLGDDLSKAYGAASNGRVLHVIGRHGEANTLYEEAARTFRAFGLDREAGLVQKQRVDSLTQLGRYEEAMLAARVTRRLLAGAGQVQLAQLEVNVGNIHYRLDRYRKALDCYDRARKTLARSGDADMRAHVDLSRSNIFAETDRPLGALKLLNKSAVVWERGGQSVIAAQARLMIAFIQFLRGNYNQALKGYNELRERLTRCGTERLVAWCDLDIARIMLSLNSFEDAGESGAAARASFNKLGMPCESAHASLITALSAMGLGHRETALADLNFARRVFVANKNVVTTGVIDCYLAELAITGGQPDEADRLARRALRTFTRHNLPVKAGYARVLLARAAYQSGKHGNALRSARAAIRAVRDRFAPAIVYVSHNLIGKIERVRGRQREAIESFRRAVKTIERMRGGIAGDELKATFLRDKIEIYEDAIKACLDGQSGRTEEAFQLVESCKSRALADMISRYVRESSAGPNARQRAERARLLKLIEEFNWYNSQVGIEDDKGGQRNAEAASRYNREVLRRERQIARRFRQVEADDSVFQTRAASALDLRETLEEDETAVEYFSTGDEVSAFIASRDRLRVVRGVASATEIRRALGALRFQLDKFNYGPEYAEKHLDQLNQAVNAHLGWLYQNVFAAIEPHVAGEKLIIVPHGSLHYAPFHALINRRGYLVDQFHISYAPSATVLKLCRNRMKGRAIKQNGSTGARNGGSHTLVAVGVSDSRTPNIEQEIQALRKLFRGSVTLLGEEATLKNLLKHAPRATLLHLASHGHFRSDNPMFSFLKLADSPLNFYSLLDLKLNAELVTLSACHTGANQVFPGDELHGLMRGFLHAGAPTLVASLWAASDESTTEFMKVMYSEISAGASKRSALRAAQLAIKDGYGHPYYWAPFILMGDPG